VAINILDTQRVEWFGNYCLARGWIRQTLHNRHYKRTTAPRKARYVTCT